jgi:hypothetical protein
MSQKSIEYDKIKDGTKKINNYFFNRLNVRNREDEESTAWQNLLDR